jgi:hypothetical protein
MSLRREVLTFGATLALLVGGFLNESLRPGQMLSPADVIYSTAGFEEFHGPLYEPANRLLIDPVLQFQPWLELNRAALRAGRLPLWNALAGCGAPHLANGQSAVFDPFHLIAYLGPLPRAHAAMAAARLWVAGLGMFLLARRWGLGAWGRWFAGLTFPFCGFLVVWLLFPVSSAAVWMPWALLATDRALDHPDARTACWLALAVGASLLAGHVQTSAHVLLAIAGYAAWKWWVSPRGTVRLGAWAGGVGLGIALAAIEVIPLGFYLGRSPVWTDRYAERPALLSLTRPRLLDVACTALPYLYGSQRRGHPNLARGLGVHNLNESAGGFAGLTTLLWLAPAGWASRREVRPASLLGGLLAAGTLAAFEVPPVTNLLRGVPVLNVMDHRRLTLWVAFGLVMLGAIGLDRLERRRALPRGWLASWIVAACLLFLSAILVARLGEPVFRDRVLGHYAAAARTTPGSDPAIFAARAERQVHQMLDFVPSYALIAGLHLLSLAALGITWRRGVIGPRPLRIALLVVVLLDLLGFGYGLNPAIARGDDRPVGALIAYLKREVPPPARILALGTALPPNTLMRYGLADVRNYDSVESARNLAYFAALYEPGRSRTSRREVTWDGVRRSLGRLRRAGVAAVVAPSAPPGGLFDRVDRVGRVWVGRLGPSSKLTMKRDHNTIRADVPAKHVGPLIMPESFDPGWRAEADGRPVVVSPYDGAFLGVELPPGTRTVVLRFDPPEVRLAIMVTCAAAFAVVLGLSGVPSRRGARKTGFGSWMVPRRRVRIGRMTSTRPSSPASH